MNLLAVILVVPKDGSSGPGGMPFKTRGAAGRSRASKARARRTGIRSSSPDHDAEWRFPR